MRAKGGDFSRKAADFNQLGDVSCRCNYCTNLELWRKASTIEILEVTELVLLNKYNFVESLGGPSRADSNGLAYFVNW